MSLRSPKAKFSGDIHFDTPHEGIGSVVLFTSNNIDELKEWLKPYAPGHIRIFENKKTYPSFDWVLIESYEI